MWNRWCNVFESRDIYFDRRAIQFFDSTGLASPLFANIRLAQRACARTVWQMDDAHIHRLRRVVDGLIAWSARLASTLRVVNSIKPRGGNSGNRDERSRIHNRPHPFDNNADLARTLARFLFFTSKRVSCHQPNFVGTGFSASKTSKMDALHTCHLRDSRNWFCLEGITFLSHVFGNFDLVCRFVDAHVENKRSVKPVQFAPKITSMLESCRF